ncbi:hypothetical protein D8Y22_19650 [Salinadaptatus halalkaliphilus]|uniref:DUF7260 domain-containing protein n=1 Tax=Salinadaptatus halalkaliphilus TaxID=2419781 RepID=A0A4S3TH57_9EURY|nr:hypothetical protein [Salinadaptatus halalkaliphilus]THE63202.1 hypothetical protein D8Y22_19650 [Salinadaptatus halalkaliphilus]
MQGDIPTIDFDHLDRLLERERGQLREERRAFERFGTRIRELEPTSTRSPKASPSTTTTQLGGTTSVVSRTRPQPSGLSAVTATYKKTVLDVSHYESVYGEPWDEHMAAEFGPEIAAAVAQATQLHPQLQQSLRTATTQAIENRTQLLEQLESEADAITDAERMLTSICADLRSILEQPIESVEYNALRLTRRRLVGLRQHCDELAARRQRQVRQNRQCSLARVGTFERYLYEDAECTYPVLASIAEVGDSIERARTTVETGLFGRRS